MSTCSDRAHTMLPNDEILAGFHWQRCLSQGLMLEYIQISVLSTAILKPSELCKRKGFWNKFGSTVWMEGMNLFIFSLPFHVVIGSVCCRNVDVVDCRLLPQTWAGFYIIHGAIGLNILDNVWAISLNFKITPYSAFTASAPLRFLAKGLYTYKSSISFVIVIS